MYDGDVKLDQGNNPRTKIVKLIRPESRVLDVGCATGFMSEYLTRDLHCRVTGVEADGEAAQIAKSRGIEVLSGDIEQDSVIDQIAGQYDYVILGDILEHLTRPELTLGRLVQHLTEGGHMLISVPNVAHWSVRLRLMLGRFDYTDGGILDRNHLRFFTKKTATTCIEQRGLRIASIDYVHVFPGARYLPMTLRSYLVRTLPGLFTWQFIIDAVKR